MPPGRSSVRTDEPRRLPSRASASPEARLLWQADALLALLPQLRATGFVADLARLRERLSAELGAFRSRARADGIASNRIDQATEVLATLIDHVVTSMPWGADAGWRSLGAATAPAPERRVAPSPSQHLLELARTSSSDADMQELIGVGLALALDGRSDAEQTQIERVRAQIPLQDSQRGAREPQELSPQWQSPAAGSAGSSWLPLWVSTLGATALLAVLFFVLELSLGARSDRLYARIAGLHGPIALAPHPLPASLPRLAGALSEQISSRSLSVRDEIDRSVIVIPGTRLFEPGGATLRPEGATLLRPVAAALQGTPGPIQVIGHTQGGLNRSARYPSDWDLSVDRARVAQEALRGLGITASRLSADGRADTEPAAIDRAAVADQQSARVGGDGRIEIVLLAGR